jgi:cell wall assembly regulator SMI1
VTRSVGESWALIGDWLRRRVPHVHARLAPPATDGELREVEDALGVDLPADLADWWRGANGILRGSWSEAQIVPPGFLPMSTRDAIKYVRETRDIAIDTADSWRYSYEAVDRQTDADEYDAAVARLMREPAGSRDQDPEHRLVHLPAWVMFARESDGYFVDCRSGPQRGCVMRVGAHGGWSGPLWPSVAALWEETSDLLTGLDHDDRPELVQTSAGEWRIPGA